MIFPYHEHNIKIVERGEYMKGLQGFASMDKRKQREIASRGGTASAQARRGKSQSRME